MRHAPEMHRHRIRHQGVVRTESESGRRMTVPKEEKVFGPHGIRCTEAGTQIGTVQGSKDVATRKRGRSGNKGKEDIADG